MSTSLYHINKQQTSILKAVAITLIVFHNFLHLTNGIGENEMSFTASRVFDFFAFMKASPWLIPDALFSYLGHYGVELFIFCSGYGLCKQYMKRTPASYKQYLLPKVSKIYLLLLLGLIVCYVFLMDRGVAWYLQFSLISLSMLKNVSVYYLYQGVGPWWYFSLAIQLYLLFPLLYRLLVKYQQKGFYVMLPISYVLIYALFPLAELVRFPIYGNCIGHLPEFILGIGLALLPGVKLDWRVVSIAGVVFVLGNFYAIAFPLSFLSVTILLLAGLMAVIPHLSKRWVGCLEFVGKISMIVFVINGPMRDFTTWLFVDRLSLAYFPTSVLHYFIVLGCSYPLYLVYEHMVKLTDKYLLARL